MEVKAKRGRPPKGDDNKARLNLRLDPKTIELLKQFGAVKTIEAAVPYYLNAVNSGLIDPP